ncbi:hypothetical protein HDU86_000926 [Geranomyces michiganensis]|nr:hypothetical protein HDU86_000926 [Geranomyces michiganensis]
MDAEEGNADNVAALAKDSTRQEKKTWLPAIPLTVLAPLIIVLTLIGSLTPVGNGEKLGTKSIVRLLKICVSFPQTYVYLITGMNDAVNLLSQEYLSTVMQDVNHNLRFSVQRYYPIAKYYIKDPAVRESLMGNPNNTLQLASWVPSIVNMHIQNKLDVVSCARSMWRPGFGPGSNVTVETVRLLQMSTYNHPLFKPIVYRYDYGSGTDATVYKVNTTTFKPDDAALATNFAFADNISVRHGLNATLIRREPYFNAQYFASSTAELPEFYCTIGQRVDVSWNSILRDARPNNDSFVAVFKQDWTIGGSSNMVYPDSNTVDAQGNIVFKLPVPDELTLAFQTFIVGQYNESFRAVATDEVLRTEANVVGTKWILMTQAIRMSSYADQDMLLITAIPRKDVYGAIEHSRTQALAVSLGIASAMALLSITLFIFVVLPLFKLARAMQTLTKLDFGSLERSNTLDDRSFIREVRQVQIVFATMVKAFAGGLKRNKAMIAATVGNQSSSGGASASAGSKKKPDEASTLLPKK